MKCMDSMAVMLLMLFFIHYTRQHMRLAKTFDKTVTHMCFSCLVPVGDTLQMFQSHVEKAYIIGPRLAAST